MNKKRLLYCGASLALLSAILGWGLWTQWTRYDTSREVAVHSSPLKDEIVMTRYDARGAISSIPAQGGVRVFPPSLDLAEAFALDSNHGWSLRSRALDLKRGSGLSAAEIVLLRTFVVGKALPKQLKLKQWRALKNDALNLLCAEPGVEMADFLRSIYDDSEQDAGLRDYALQHLVTLIEKDPTLGWASHWSALEGTDAALAATALLHLSRMRNDQLTVIQRERLELVALRLASDLSAKDTSRLTALQVCARMKVVSARPLAREIALSEVCGVLLRISAVAALGDLGGDQSLRDVLVVLSTGPEERLRVPAQAALKRFQII